MPSPFHQKYSSQNHKFFGDNTMPVMPEGPKQDVDRRSSVSSTSSGSFAERRRSSTTQRFGNLEALKRPHDGVHNRRASLQDAYVQKPGFLGSMWNNFIHGTGSAARAPQAKQQRDSSTLRS